MWVPRTHVLACLRVCVCLWGCGVCCPTAARPTGSCPGLSPYFPTLTSVSVLGPSASQPLACLPAPALLGDLGPWRHSAPPSPAPGNPCLAAPRMAVAAETCPQLMVSPEGHCEGQRVSTGSGSPAGSEDPFCSPTPGRTERLPSALLPFCRPGPEGQLAAKALRKGSQAPHPPGLPPPRPTPPHPSRGSLLGSLSDPPWAWLT